MNRILNPCEAAELLCVAEPTLRDWRGRRVGPPYIVISARCIRYSERDVISWRDERRIVPYVRETKGRYAAR